MAFVTVGCKLPNGIHLDVQDKRVTLNGANSSRIIGGYGLTQVDKDFWDAWVKAYADSPMLKNHLVFAQGTEANASAKAEEQAEVKSGFERLQPGKGVLAEVQTADKAA